MGSRAAPLLYGYVEGRSFHLVSLALVAATAVWGCANDDGQHHGNVAQATRLRDTSNMRTGRGADVCAMRRMQGTLAMHAHPAMSSRAANRTCEPLDCDDGNPCGAYGTCVEAPSGDRCECIDDHAGRTCALCAEGLQDNDANGTYDRPALTPSWPAPPGACDDATGTVSCGCSPHSTGRHCDECEAGYYRPADGPLREGVRLQGRAASHGAARKSKARMLHVPVPGSEGRSLWRVQRRPFPPWQVVLAGGSPVGGSLLVGSTDMNWDYLAELDLVTKALTPLRSGIPYLLSADRTKHELWGGDRQRDQRIHLRPR